jgi:hypothetical protein
LERTYISVNFPNAVAILIIIALGYVALLLASQFGLRLFGIQVQPGGFPGASLIFGGGTAGVSPLTAGS